MLISISPVSSIIFTKSETEMLSSLEARTTLTFWPSRETKISLMRQKVDKYTTDKCLFDCDNKVTKGGGIGKGTPLPLGKKIFDFGTSLNAF